MKPTAICIFLYFLLLPSFIACNKEASTKEHEKEENHAHEDSDGTHDEIEVSQAQMDAAEIKLGSLERRSISESIFTTGRIEAGVQDVSVVAPGLPGRVTEILVSEGQLVKAGQIVAYLEAPEIITMRQDYREAYQKVEAARVEVERQKALAVHGAGIKKNLDGAQAELSMAQLVLDGCRKKLVNYGISVDAEGTAYPVKSAITGTVTEVVATIGSFSDPQIPIAKIVNTDGIFCQLDVIEKDLGLIRQGQSVEMRLTNDPDKRFEGTVVNINPNLNPTTRTVPVKVMLNGSFAGLHLVPGMAVSASVATSGEPVTALPETAVVSALGRHYIFVLEDIHEEEGQKMYHFEKREVTCGVTVLGYTQVTPVDPLESDAQIVVDGAFYLNSMASDHGEHSH